MITRQKETNRFLTKIKNGSSFVYICQNYAQVVEIMVNIMECQGNLGSLKEG
jgi:hypothetical protein